jgi:hypothetical protein
MPLLSQILAESITDTGIKTTDIYATPDLLPLFGVSGGSQAFVTSTNRFYIWNGTLIATKTGVNQALGPQLDIGVQTGLWFSGYMSDIRLTKGVARYTANFTPPTASLGFSNAG